MCAAVAVIPVTEIFALTERSSLIVTVPLPDAAVVTGGTSFRPRQREPTVRPSWASTGSSRERRALQRTATAVIQCVLPHHLVHGCSP
jgi:hypothetical protein